MVIVVSVVAMATGVKNFKKRGKMDIFVICVILKCHLPPVDTPKASVWLFETSFIFFLDQFIPIFYMTNIFVV